jgi:hypothetical protein
MTFFGSALTRNYKAFRICIYAGLLMVFGMGLNLAEAAAPKVYDIKIVEMAGRPGHQGLFPIQGQPITGAKAIVQAHLNGFADKVNLVLRDKSGELLSKIPMIVPPADKVVRGTYFADIVIPSVPFTMSISGIDQAGNAFEGTPKKSSTSTPQTFDIRIIPTIFQIPPDIPIYFSVRITNFGAADTFKVSLIDDFGGTVEPAGKEVLLDTNKSTEVQFLYTAPSNIKGGLTRITLTATAASITSNSSVNQAQLTLSTPILVPGKLIAWLSPGEQGMLGRNRKVPLTVWMCNDQIDSTTILLANNVPPSNIKSIPQSPPNAGLPSENIACLVPSRLKLEFDSTKLTATLRESMGLTSQSRLIQVPISAYRPDGMPMFGYIPLVIDAKTNF